MPTILFLCTTLRQQRASQIYSHDFTPLMFFSEVYPTSYCLRESSKALPYLTCYRTALGVKSFASLRDPNNFIKSNYPRSWPRPLRLFLKTNSRSPHGRNQRAGAGSTGPGPIAGNSVRDVTGWDMERMCGGWQRCSGAGSIVVLFLSIAHVRSIPWIGMVSRAGLVPPTAIMLSVSSL